VSIASVSQFELPRLIKSRYLGWFEQGDTVQSREDRFELNCKVYGTRHQKDLARQELRVIEQALESLLPRHTELTTRYVLDLVLGRKNIREEADLGLSNKRKREDEED